VLFDAYRYHAFFTDSSLTLIEADRTRRAHAIIEQVIADLENGPLAHLPSGKFTANAAWLALAAIAFNLTRAACCLASRLHARAARWRAQPGSSCSTSPSVGPGSTPTSSGSPPPPDPPPPAPDHPLQRQARLTAHDVEEPEPTGGFRTPSHPVKIT